MADQVRAGTVRGVGEGYLVRVVPSDHADPEAMSAALKSKGYRRRGGRAVSVEGMPGAIVFVKRKECKQ